MILDAAVRLRAEGRVGERLGGTLSLERLLGVGGMAAVYAAREDGGDRVAVKVLHPELAAAEGVRRRFVDEAQVANRIAHEGVVRVRGAFDDDDTSYLVMDLLVGRTLEEELRRAGGTIPVARALAIGDALLAVLEAAHAGGIVHRDVKPANVFLVEGGGVRVLDFGIARLLEQPRATPTGDSVGTAEFMAPEQARGKRAEVDARTDVYAVGALLFTAITGRFVFPTTNALERLILTATRQAPAIKSVRPETSDDVAHVVDVALSFDPSDRWSSAAEMRAAVREALEGDLT